MTIRSSFMREHFLSGHRHLGFEDLAVQRVGDVKGGAFRPAVRDVGHEAILFARIDEMGWQAVRVEAPDAHSQVAHGEALLVVRLDAVGAGVAARSEEHTSELQSQSNLVCRLLLEKKKNN